MNCLSCNHPADAHPPDHAFVSRDAVLEALDRLLESANSIVETSAVKCIATYFDASRFDGPIPFRFVVENAKRPIVLACLKLLVALGEGPDAVHAWIDEHAPGGPKSRRNQELTAMRVLHPDAWADLVATAVRTNESKPKAAKVLRVGVRTLNRWLHDARVKERLER